MTKRLSVNYGRLGWRGGRGGEGRGKSREETEKKRRAERPNLTRRSFVQVEEEEGGSRSGGCDSAFSLVLHFVLPPFFFSFPLHCSCAPSSCYRAAAKIVIVEIACGGASKQATPTT